MKLTTTKALVASGVLSLTLLASPVMADMHHYDHGYDHGHSSYRPSNHHGYPALGTVFLSLAIGDMAYHLINQHQYYQDGPVWYMHDTHRNAYVVVNPPVQSTTQVIINQPVISSSDVPAGAVYPTLPTGSVAVSINGIQYFEKDGTLFLPTQQGGRQVYVVVKNP